MEVEQELDGNHSSAEYVCQVLGVDGELMDAVPGSNLNSKHMLNAVQHVAGYKVLDIFDWITSGSDHMFHKGTFATEYLHKVPTLDILVHIALSSSLLIMFLKSG